MVHHKKELYIVKIYLIYSDLLLLKYSFHLGEYVTKYGEKRKIFLSENVKGRDLGIDGLII